MAKQPIPIALPIVELLTGDEIQEAMARFILARKGVFVADTDALLRRTQTQVSYRNVKLPDGSVSLFASVGIFPLPKDERKATDTPIPQEPKDG